MHTSTHAYNTIQWHAHTHTHTHTHNSQILKHIHTLKHTHIHAYYYTHAYTCALISSVLKTHKLTLVHTNTDITLTYSTHTTYTHKHTCTHTNSHTCTHNAHTLTHTREYTCVSVSYWVHVYVCVSVCKLTCWCVLFMGVSMHT